jgi:hypothetical protein
MMMGCRNVSLSSILSTSQEVMSSSSDNTNDDLYPCIGPKAVHDSGNVSICEGEYDEVVRVSNCAGQSEVAEDENKHLSFLQVAP